MTVDENLRLWGQLQQAGRLASESIETLFRSAGSSAALKFKNAIRTVAGLYDYQKDNFEKMTFLTKSGNRIGRYWEFPTTAQKLIERGQIAYDWAMQGAGWIGRSPDHVSSALVGMMTHIDVFESYSQERADALRNYFAHVSEKDLYLTYALVNPQGDRSKTPGEHSQNIYHTLGLVEKVRLMKLVWDSVGSEFASRHLQYEMFYSGSHFATFNRFYDRYDWKFSKALIKSIKEP